MKNTDRILAKLTETHAVHIKYTRDAGGYRGPCVQVEIGVVCCTGFTPDHALENLLTVADDLRAAGEDE